LHKRDRYLGTLDSLSANPDDPEWQPVDISTKPWFIFQIHMNGTGFALAGYGWTGWLDIERFKSVLAGTMPGTQPNSNPGGLL
jgi:hypothetical protein